MEAIVLAGGLGTRLRQILPPDLPKPMAPIAGKPFLDILLRLLARKGFSRVMLSVGCMAEKIMSYFGKRFAGMEIVYQVETSPLGTGGALLQTLKLCRGDHAFIFNGDTYLDLEVRDIENQWQTDSTPLIVGLEVPDTFRYGRLEVNEGLVTGFIEKKIPGPGLINSGCYVLPSNILDKFPDGSRFSIEADFLQKQVARQTFRFFLTKGLFIDIGSPDDLARAQSLLANA